MSKLKEKLKKTISIKSKWKTNFITGYYKINADANKLISLRKNIFLFISPDEYTYVNYNSAIVARALYGKFVKFEYKLLQ